jgi:hypothetical protein
VQGEETLLSTESHLAPASAVWTYMSIQKKYLSDLKFENVDLQTFLELYTGMSIIFNFHEKKNPPELERTVSPI